ncbi:MAG: hypothetical protein H7096_04965 [Flavobacterium sp.]|nr:hypothetical protein [Pedobacter sp.]
MINNITPDIFLRENIDLLTKSFSKIACKYEFHSTSDSYYLEVLPKMNFESQISLRRELSKILKNFINTFPDETLVFFSSGDGIELANPSYMRFGSDYLSWLNLNSFRKILDNRNPIRNHDKSFFSPELFLAA